MINVHDKLMAKLESLAAQYEEMGQQLTDPAFVGDHQRVRQIGIRRAAMEGLVRRYLRYRELVAQVSEHEQLVEQDDDAELAELAREELPALRQEADDLLEAVSNELVTADDRAVGSVILEVRAAAGGAEAGLWAGDVFAMYQKYAERRGWKIEVAEFSPGDQGGLRQVVAVMQGPAVWQGMGYEGGVHCVKRVPATEAQGRVHTSTCTVAVLPEPEKVDIDIPESDVTIHVTTAQGPGGQNVNKVATAVHMVHNPTGIEVRMQESKSQQQNRQKAWQLLRARVYDHMQRQKDVERSQSRNKMIGSGERSERIRTYRYKESIVVDHRLNDSFPLQAVLAGHLDPIVDGLISLDRAQRLASM